MPSRPPMPVSRDLVRGYFGGSEQLVATAFVSVDFTVELAGSAVAACATGDACEGGARACAGHR